MSKCKHTQCSDCQTKRGNNRGNRNERHNVKMALLNFKKKN